MFISKIRTYAVLLSIVFSFFSEAYGKELNIVTTGFPQYDLVRHIVGEHSKVKILLKPGADSHSFEPSPNDIISIMNSDLFVFNGGENDEWIENLLKSSDKKIRHFAFTDKVKLREEEEKEGMEKEKDKPGHDSDEVEYDEHVWTSPLNDEKLIKLLADEIIKLDPDNKDAYRKNADLYIKDFKELDGEIRNIIKDSNKSVLIFGDRFPLLYFVKDYSLDYFAAFKGCSDDSEVSPATIRFLIDKARENKSKTILKIELTSDSIANTVAQAVDANVAVFNTGHNVTKEQFKNNESLISLFRSNLPVLKKALQ